MLHGQTELVPGFLGCGPFPGGWQCWVLLCGGVAPPEGRQARAGKAPAVVGFLQMVRSANWDVRQPQVQHVHTGLGEGGYTGKHSFLIAVGKQAQASELALVWGVFYGGPLLLLYPPQLWCLVSPADPALLPGSL